MPGRKMRSFWKDFGERQKASLHRSLVVWKFYSTTEKDLPLSSLRNKTCQKMQVFLAQHYKVNLNKWIALYFWLFWPHLIFLTLFQKIKIFALFGKIWLLDFSTALIITFWSRP